MEDQAVAVRTIARLARLLECGCADLSLAQYRILAMVDAGDERASRLAERLAVAKPTVTAVVDGLVERGCLKRSPVPGDRRAIRITITAAGRRTLRAAETAMAQRLEPVMSRLEHPSRTAAALGALGKALDALADERLQSGTLR
ncbi:MAG: MarR family transcriptional regulator [Actinomycetota bacterium]|nr:MarR family transcriptional regulator [Actinomycetota bacterium]MDQ3679492.1 MarR family transcriptional regulator [Actinomycetota bacterium]